MIGSVFMLLMGAILSSEVNERAEEKKVIDLHKRLGDAFWKNLDERVDSDRVSERKVHDLLTSLGVPRSYADSVRGYLQKEVSFRRSLASTASGEEGMKRVQRMAERDGVSIDDYRDIPSYRYPKYAGKPGKENCKNRTAPIASGHMMGGMQQLYRLVRSEKFNDRWAEIFVDDVLDGIVNGYPLPPWIWCTEFGDVIGSMAKSMMSAGFTKEDLENGPPHSGRPLYTIILDSFKIDIFEEGLRRHSDLDLSGLRYLTKGQYLGIHDSIYDTLVQFGAPESFARAKAHNQAVIALTGSIKRRSIFSASMSPLPAPYRVREMHSDKAWENRLARSRDLLMTLLDRLSAQVPITVSRREWMERKIERIEPRGDYLLYPLFLPENESAGVSILNNYIALAPDVFDSYSDYRSSMGKSFMAVRGSIRERLDVTVLSGSIKSSIALVIDPDTMKIVATVYVDVHHDDKGKLSSVWLVDIDCYLGDTECSRIETFVERELGREDIGNPKALPAIEILTPSAHDGYRAKLLTGEDPVRTVRDLEENTSDGTIFHPYIVRQWRSRKPAIGPYPVSSFIVSVLPDETIELHSCTARRGSLIDKTVHAFVEDLRTGALSLPGDQEVFETWTQSSTVDLEDPSSKKFMFFGNTDMGAIKRIAIGWLLREWLYGEEAQKSGSEWAKSYLDASDGTDT